MAQLDERLWQHHPGREVTEADWVEVEDGERKTLVIEADGQRACVFSNRPGFAGGAGCAEGS